MKFRGAYTNGPAVKHALAATVSTDVNGDATYTFPEAFPNALLGFQVTEATAPGVLGAVVIKALSDSDRTQIKFRVYASDSGLVIASFVVTVNITAFGV